MMDQHERECEQCAGDGGPWSTEVARSLTRGHFLERDAFTGRVVSSLDEPAVRGFVADRLSRVVAGAGGGASNTASAMRWPITAPGAQSAPSATAWRSVPA